MKNQPGKSNRAIKPGIVTTLLVLTLIASSQVLAQNEARSWAQFFGGVGALTGGGDSQSVLHIGAGGEGLLAGGFGVTGEIGYLSNFQDFSGGIGVFSAGGMYAFNRDRKTVPFVNGGYTLFFRSGTANGFFFGGGVNHWMGEKWGIRIEGRDQVWASDTSIHTLEVRFALLLR
jgi:hypothetical protein